MSLHRSKKFIAGVLLLVLSFASLAWVSTRTSESSNAPAVAAQSPELSRNAGAATQSQLLSDAANDSAAADETRFAEGYRAGYRDAQADLAAARAEGVSYTGRSSYRRARVVRAGNRTAARRGHSTRNMILRIAAPAAIGAGVGAIVGGKKGAGIGALLGGGGGAIYHLKKRR